MIRRALFCEFDMTGRKGEYENGDFAEVINARDVQESRP